MNDATPTITSTVLNQTLGLVLFAIIFTILGSIGGLVSIILSWLRGVRQARRSNNSNPELIGAMVRSAAGLFSNYSMILFPITFIAYRRNIRMLQVELAGRMEISRDAEQACRTIAVEVGLAHVAVIVIPALLTPVFGPETFGALVVLIVCCMAGAMMCWDLLGRIDHLMLRPQ